VPVDPAVLAAVCPQLGHVIPGIAPDGWAPSVQGAVGHVIGMHAPAGDRFVLKIYPDGGSPLRETEESALRVVADHPGVIVPRVVTSGAEPSTQREYLLMTRLDGVRWADRRRALSDRELTTLTADAGRALRRLHAGRGPYFGSLAAGGPRWVSAREMVQSLSATWLGQYRAGGGPDDIADAVRDLVHHHRPAVEACATPVLCHNDFIDGNLIVADAGPPHLSGIVDFERASWNDPMSDLAQTRVHVRFHDPAGVPFLTDAYGELSDAERQRVAVYEALHLLRERSWIAYDRPAGWQQSIGQLDAILAACA
jgi:hygromycin-B 7''-O-kinase